MSSHKSHAGYVPVGEACQRKQTHAHTFVGRVENWCPPQDAFGPAASFSKSSKNLVLEDCLRQFSTVEALEDDFKPSYRCARCGVDGSKSYASRRMWIWPVKLPPVLTLQLKRFRRYMDRFEKSVASVALPMVLDVSRFVLTESEFHGLQSHVAEGLELKDALLGGSNGSSLCYELYGICVHTGSMKGLPGLNFQSLSLALGSIIYDVFFFSCVSVSPC